MTVFDGLKLGRFPGSLEAVRVQRVGRAPGPLVEGLVHRHSHNRGAFVHVGAKAACMVEMRVRIDEVVNRFAGNDLFDFGNHGKRASLVQRRIDDDDVVPLFDGNAMPLSAPDPVNAVGQLIGDDLDGGSHRGTHALRHGDDHLGIRTDGGYGDVQPQFSALRADNVAGEHHAAEIAVVSERGFAKHVAQDRDCRSRCGRSGPRSAS